MNKEPLFMKAWLEEYQHEEYTRKFSFKDEVNMCKYKSKKQENQPNIDYTNSNEVEE